MLPPLAPTCMAVLDYLAHETDPGEEIRTYTLGNDSRRAWDAKVVSPRSVRRRIRVLHTYGLVVYTRNGSFRAATVRITPAGRRMIAAYYKNTEPSEE